MSVKRINTIISLVTAWIIVVVIIIPITTGGGNCI